MGEQILQLDINGKQEAVFAAASETLASVLRERLYLTGTKIACEEGECGACTVLVDGQAVNACIYPALAARGRHVETVEGLADCELGSRLQKALVDCGGVQCGFCTPGFVVMLTALLRENSRPSMQEVRMALAGNICRCTGYAQIEDAVSEIIESMGGAVT